MGQNTLGIIIEGGVVHSVVTDDEKLRELQCVVVEDGQASKLMTPNIEAEITNYVEAARGANMCEGLALACELAADQFLTLARAGEADPEQLFEDIETLMGVIINMVKKSVSSAP